MQFCEIYIKFGHIYSQKNDGRVQRTMFSTPADVSKMGSQGSNIYSSTGIKSQGVPMATKDHPKHHQLGVKHPSGLAPSILCMLAHFHGLLALPGCLKWTILPPPKAYVEKSFREPQFLYFTIKTKDTNRMNPCTSSLLTLFQEQTFYQTFNFCRYDFFLLPLNFSLHLYNCRPAAVPQMVVGVLGS